MSAVAQIENGKVVESKSASSIAKSIKKDGSTLDKDAFLGLLVAQMKYQDPLEPTSNTEFVSQYAQFSSLEQMQNMSATLELSRASAMVGQVVSVNTTDSNGQSTAITGKVDYVTYENNKAYVSIGGALYSLDDVYEVLHQDYLDAYDLAYQFAVAMNMLPSYENLSLSDKENIDKLNEVYNGMSDYTKSFVAKDYTDKLEKYTKRMDELVDDLIGEFKEGIYKLPQKDELSLDDKEAVEGLNEMYDSMSEFEKSLVPESYLDQLKEYTKLIEEMEKGN